MRKHNKNRAFTLIEILIVVVILGILAAIIIPQFTEASDDAAVSSVRSTLQSCRSQFELYKFKENAAPADLDAMVTAGYLPENPNDNAPSGWTFSVIDADSDGTNDGVQVTDGTTTY